MTFMTIYFRRLHVLMAYEPLRNVTFTYCGWSLKIHVNEITWQSDTFVAKVY